jgi:hypothetical protein
MEGTQAGRSRREGERKGEGERGGRRRFFYSETKR